MIEYKYSESANSHVPAEKTSVSVTIWRDGLGTYALALTTGIASTNARASCTMLAIVAVNGASGDELRVRPPFLLIEVTEHGD